MIKNSKQAAITKTKLEQIKQDFAEYQKTQETILHPVRFKLGSKAFEGLIKDLSEQVAQYEKLTKSAVNQFAGYSVNQLASVLTQARLARDMSQKLLAEKLGVQEQQIQRYEQDDYTKASWSRILEVYQALNLDIKLTPFEITKAHKQAAVPAQTAVASKWGLQNYVKREVVTKATRNIKTRKSLFQFAQ
jgi:transcriptional regulator with XRE-family HTH domain